MVVYTYVWSLVLCLFIIYVSRKANITKTTLMLMTIFAFIPFVNTVMLIIFLIYTIKISKDV